MMPNHEEGLNRLARRGRHHGPDHLLTRVEVTLGLGPSHPRGSARSRPMLIGACLALAAVGVLAMVARDTSEPGQSVATEGSPRVPQLQDLDSSDSWVAALAGVPLDLDDPVIAVLDQARVRAQLDLAAPDGVASDEEVVEYLVAISQPLVGWDVVTSAPGSGSEPTPAELRGELGFDQRFLNRILEVSSASDDAFPTRSLTYFEGSFVAGEIDQAIRSHDTWSGAMTVAEHAGYPYYRWDAPERVEMERATPLRPLGRPFQLAVTGPNEVILATDEADLRQALEVIGGSRRSVLAHPQVLLAAEIADAQHLVAATIAVAQRDRAGTDAYPAVPVGALAGVALEGSNPTHYYVEMYADSDEAAARLPGIEGVVGEQVERLAEDHHLDVEIWRESEAVIVSVQGLPSTSPPMGQWFAAVWETPPATAPADAPAAYVQAFEDFLECLDEAEVQLDGLTWNEDQRRYDYSFPTADLAAHDRCYGRHLRSVNMSAG